MKSTSVKSILIVALAMVVLLAVATTGLSQVTVPKIIQCAMCKHENAWIDKFCIKCGADLTVMKEVRQKRLEAELSAKEVETPQKMEKVNDQTSGGEVKKTSRKNL